MSRLAFEKSFIQDLESWICAGFQEAMVSFNHHDDVKQV
jgi:hypothetical protein